MHLQLALAPSLDPHTLPNMCPHPLSTPRALPAPLPQRRPSPTWAPGHRTELAARMDPAYGRLP
jgi:hypothetical protein